MTLTWPSPAKLNLFLYITGQKPNGYHELQTLFQFLDYGDSITITPIAEDRITLLTPLKGVEDQDNLIIKAAQCLKKQTGYQGGAEISIKKVLPMGGGLGGGSSNAATVLVALNTLWQCQLTQKELASIGVTLGADVPVFIFGHSAFAEGIGEKLQAVDVPEKWYLVLKPNISISTAAIFQDPDLKRDSKKLTINELLNKPFTNDCEDIVRKRFNEVEQLISWLLQYAPTRLTGTGACVFAEFDTEAAAREVLSQTPTQLYGFVAKGVNTSPLHLMLSELGEVS